ncbi:uncharacterized protein G2W53_024252 [Senna tora]|uniref:Uncharacterized protein n=1 Tax=Senna tora TaxID=362788 RepID=A0A834WDR3_9FABA|nr:uncharacterized protein G2W53_024252 [Senna tora]
MGLSFRRWVDEWDGYGDGNRDRGFGRTMDILCFICVQKKEAREASLVWDVQFHSVKERIIQVLLSIWSCLMTGNFDEFHVVMASESWLELEKMEIVILLSIHCS